MEVGNLEYNFESTKLNFIWWSRYTIHSWIIEILWVSYYNFKHFLLCVTVYTRNQQTTFVIPSDVIHIDQQSTRIMYKINRKNVHVVTTEWRIQHSSSWQNESISIVFFCTMEWISIRSLILLFSFLLRPVHINQYKREDVWSECKKSFHISIQIKSWKMLLMPLANEIYVHFGKYYMQHYYIVLCVCT